MKPFKQDNTTHVNTSCLYDVRRYRSYNWTSRQYWNYFKAMDDNYKRNLCHWLDTSPSRRTNVVWFSRSSITPILRVPCSSRVTRRWSAALPLLCDWFQNVDHRWSNQMYFCGFIAALRRLVRACRSDLPSIFPPDFNLPASLETGLHLVPKPQANLISCQPSFQNLILASFRS